MVADVEKPDRMVFDLDPDEGLDFDAVKKAARDLRGHLADIGLHHLPDADRRQGRACRRAADAEGGMAGRSRISPSASPLALAEAEPDRFTATLSKAKRTGRIFIDYLRNQRGCDRGPALFRPRPRRRAGRRADRLGGAGRDGRRRPFHRARR